jgi:hypothetical protein
MEETLKSDERGNSAAPWFFWHVATGVANGEMIPTRLIQELHGQPPSVIMAREPISAVLVCHIRANTQKSNPTRQTFLSDNRGVDAVLRKEANLRNSTIFSGFGFVKFSTFPGSSTNCSFLMMSGAIELFKMGGIRRYEFRANSSCPERTQQPERKGSGSLSRRRRQDHSVGLLPQTRQG